VVVWSPSVGFARAAVSRVLLIKGVFPPSSHSHPAAWLLWPLALPPLGFCLGADVTLMAIPLLLFIYGEKIKSFLEPPVQAVCLCSTGEVSGSIAAGV